MAVWREMAGQDHGQDNDEEIEPAGMLDVGAI